MTKVLRGLRGATTATANTRSDSRGDRGAPRRENRSEEHTSELQSPYDLVCRLLPEKKNKASDFHHQPVSSRRNLKCSLACAKSYEASYGHFALRQAILTTLPIRRNI